MKIEIYTDGSSLGNPGRGGWGSVVVHSDKIIHELGGFEKDTTNNRMELQAVIGALSYASSRQGLDDEIKEITIYADSAYVLGGVTSWVASWEKNGWKTSKKEPVLNQDLWKILIALVRASEANLSWQKVKGHAGHVYNERADEIATGCAELQKNITL
jgi:ribonuclease HI